MKDVEVSNHAGAAAGPGALALQRCDELIGWYESRKNSLRLLDNLMQTSVILAAGFTAFAAAIESWPKWAVVLPAVITTVATGLSTNFRFRSKFVNFASAAERLKWVRLRYQIRSQSGRDDAGSLDDFVEGMEAIVASELSEWREGLLAADGATRPRPGGERGKPLA